MTREFELLALDELRAEIHRSVGGVIRQMYLAILGQMAVLLGFAYFFCHALTLNVACGGARNRVVLRAEIRLSRRS